MHGADGDAPRYGILGPLRVGGDSGDVRIRSRLQRVLLAALLVDANHSVSTDRLADELWGDALPDDPAGALRSQVSRLRKLLPDGTPLVTDEGGYRLTVNRDALDAERFEHLLDAAADLRGEDALRLIDNALQLWRGVPLEEFIDRPFAQVESRRLQELHGAAREQRAALLLSTGRPADAGADMQGLLAEQPERERARALLMEALYQQGRHTSALDVYQWWRRELADEHGLEPSPELQQIEQRILQHTLTADDLIDPVALSPAPIPRPVTSFVGRDADLRGVVDLIGRARLVTLWGPGGVGKTRLALEVGAQVESDYPDGVHVCDLSVLAPGAAVARAVATAVGVQERSGRRLEGQIVDRLAGQRILVILDNCEHVLGGTAKLAQQLIQSTSGVDVLATSRERLGADGEHLWEVRPLAAASADSPAVALFVDRAHAANPSFEASPRDLVTIADICRRLDGLPLAVELAAARVRGLAPVGLLHALDQQFAILTGSATSPNRHRSLRAVIDWSYTQLEAIEQRVFDRLSVFRSPFDLSAATQVAAGDGLEDAAIVPAVLRLLDCALLVERQGLVTPRYSMLDTVRHYGLEHLEAEQRLNQARSRHAQWAVAEAERAAPGLATDAEPESAAAIDRLIDELRAAHGWLVGHDVEAALRLSAALRPYALWRGDSEIFRWAEVAAATAAASGSDSALLPEVLLAAATGAWQRGDLDAARTSARAAGDAARRASPASDRPALEAAADVAFLAGDLEAAIAAFTQAHDLAIAAGDPLQAVWDLGSAAVAVAYGGDTDRALQLAGQVLSTAERSGSPSAAAFAQFVMGEVLVDTDPETTETHLRRAIELASVADARLVIGFAEVALAASRTRGRDVSTALTYCESAVRRWHTAGAWTPLWVTLRTAIALLVRANAPDDAAVLLGAVDSPHNTAVAPFGADAVMLRDVAERLRSDLGDDAFQERFEGGRTMTRDEAVQLALDSLGRASRAGV